MPQAIQEQEIPPDVNLQNLEEQAVTEPVDNPVIEASPQPTLDIPGGSPFNKTSAPRLHHQEFYDLANAGMVQDDSLKIKQNLGQVLGELQNQMPFIQIIGQQNPELYNNINNLVKLIVQMARNNGLSKSNQKSPSEQMAESIKNMHPQHNCKNGDCYFATEALYHLLGGEASGATPFKDKDHWYLQSRTGKILDPTGGPNNGKAKRLVTTQPSKKSVGIIGAVLKQGPIAKTELIKSDLSAYSPRKVGRQYLRLPIGTTKGNKIKVMHRNGHVGWRQVQAGMVQALEPDVPLISANSHPVSVKRPFDE